MKLIIINGPNLNLLGKREPDIYGNQSFDDYFQQLKNKYPDIKLEYFQSNSEGLLINKLHEVGFSYSGIIINGGAYTHTSIAIADALAAIKTPAIEVHISNIHSREAFRHHSYFTKNCVGIISGLGLKGYDLALQYFVNQ
jgi:3-dehydroquinate dehydratase-2